MKDMNDNDRFNTLTSYKTFFKCNPVSAALITSINVVIVAALATLLFVH